MGKRNKLSKVILAGLASQMLWTVPVQANTLDQLKEQGLEKQTEISNLEWTISEKLASINEKKAGIENLNNQIQDIEAEKENTLVAIEEIKVQIAARKEQLKERLVALQTSSSATNRILMIFESDNLTDFFGRLLLVGQLQAADNERIEAAISEEQQLTNLEEKLLTEIQLVQDKTEEMDSESVVMLEQLGELQGILNENRDALQSILTARTKEESRLEEVARLEREAVEKAAAAKAEAERLAAERAAAEQAEGERLAVEQAAAEKRAEEARITAKQAEAERIAAEKAAAERKAADEAAALAAAKSAKQTPAPAPTPTPVEQPKPVEQPVAPPAAKGRQITVSATAYSRHEVGLGNFTRLGIDLRENQMVIAVDPNVIPLGTLVDVPGYGVRIAGDTGGAIIGNKIDIYIEDMATMNAFGRQSMTITVLD